MKQKILYLIPLILLFGCINYRRIDIISHNIVYSLNVPKGYYPVSFVGGHNEIEKQFIYSDSSKIYITDLLCSNINYSSLSSFGDSILKIHCDNIELKDAVSSNLGLNYKLPFSIISGKDSQGFYWKDIRNGYINVGYKGVTEAKKGMYDNYIQLLK